MSCTTAREIKIEAREYETHTYTYTYLYRYHQESIFFACIYPLIVYFILMETAITAFRLIFLSVLSKKDKPTF